MRQAIKTLSGSIVVYGIVAACSASSSTQPPIASSTGGSTSSVGGVSSVGGAQGSAGKGNGSGGALVGSTGGAVGSGGALVTNKEGGLLDAFVNPVKPVKADPVSGSRLKANFFTGSDGSKIYTGNWFDTQLSMNCTFQQLNGSNACVPVGMGTGGYFTDSGCTQKLGQAINDCGASYNKPQVIFAYASGNYCSPIIYTVGAQYTGTLYQGVPTSCTATPQTTIDALTASGLVFYSLGTQLNNSSFVTGTQGHD